MNYIFKAYKVLLLCSILTSCTDWLTEVNPNEKTVDEYYENLSDTRSGLNAVYSTLFDQYFLSIPEEAWRSDMGYPGNGRPNTTNDLGEMWYSHTYTNSPTAIEKRWDVLYKGIFRANQVIAGLESIKATSNEEQWLQQMGEARFFRGMFHFFAYNTFNEGNIIIRDVVPVTIDDHYKTITPADSVIKFIREDLKYSFKFMAPTADATGKVTKGTASNLIGLSYLYEANYDSAMVYFDDVINNPDYGYKIEQDIDKMFTTAGEFNSESIFEINYNTTNHPELSQWDEGCQTNRLAQVSMTTTGFFVPAWLAYAYKTEPLDTLDERNFFINEQENDEKQLRAVSWRASQMVTLMVDDQTPYYMTGSTSENGGFGKVDNGFSKYKKFTNHDYLTAESGLPKGAWYSGKNVTINRLSETYLNLAECHIKKGNFQQAMDLINVIRKRWGLVLIGPSQDAEHTYDEDDYDEVALMNHLMYVEKPLELSVEGHSIRWFDLRRWGIIESNFERLSDATYYMTKAKYFDDEKGRYVTKIGDIVSDKEFEFNTELVNEHTIDYEFDLANDNFEAKQQAFLRIPLAEEVKNPNF